MKYCKYKSEDGFIGSILHIPEEMRDNEFITTGYRVGYKGIKNAFKTLFIPNNETVNVWSHFLGKLFFFAVIFIIADVYPQMDLQGLFLENRIIQYKKMNPNFSTLSFINDQIVRLS